MIINSSYFTGKLNLPQTGNSEGSLIVQDFIDTYEPAYLKELMGYPLWKAFTEGIKGSPPYEQRWVNLLSGAEYTVNDRSNMWLGLKTKPSPIAAYVYYQFLEDQAQDTTLVGTAISKTTNAERANPVQKMVNAWNSMVATNLLFAEYMNANRSTYPEWNGKPVHEFFYSRSFFWNWDYEYMETCNPLFRYKNTFDI